MLLVIRRPRASLWLAAGLALGLAPAAVRNAIVAHQFSLVSSHGGLNFYIGNNARASGFYQLVAGVAPTITGQEVDTRRVAERALGRSLSDAEVSGYFVDEASTWIRAAPSRRAGAVRGKIGYTFHAQHIALPHSYPFYAYDEKTALRFYPIGPWLLTPLGLVGLMPPPARRPPVFWCGSRSCRCMRWPWPRSSSRSGIVCRSCPRSAPARGPRSIWRCARPRRGDGPLVAVGAGVGPILLGMAVNWPLARPTRGAGSKVCGRRSSS